MAEEQQQGSILHELADIKANLAVNTSQTDNIKTAISEIKTDIKEIKSDFVNRREFNEALASLREEIAPMKKFVYGLIGVVLLAVLGAIINLVIMNK